MRLLSGGSNPSLGRAVSAELDTEPSGTDLSRFPDGEVSITVDADLRDEDVFVIQSLGPPVNEHLVELLLLIDAVRRCEPARITVVMPYLGYARQDRRTEPGEPVAIRVVGDVLATLEVDRVLVIDPHTRELEAMFSVAVEAVTAVPLLAEELRGGLPDSAVIVAPDLGAVQLAERYAEQLDRPVAVVRKTRLAGDEVRADQVVGDVAGRHPILVDDMVSTGGTLAAAAQALTDAGAEETVTVAVTHGLLVGDADDTLGGLTSDRLLVTDSVPPPADSTLDLNVTTVAPLLAEAISRLHGGGQLGDIGDHR